jgi:hypothetical protein
MDAECQQLLTSNKRRLDPLCYRIPLLNIVILEDAQLPFTAPSEMRITTTSLVPKMLGHWRSIARVMLYVDSTVTPASPETGETSQ